MPVSNVTFFRELIIGITVGGFCAATLAMIPPPASALDFDFLIRDLGVSGSIQGLSETFGAAYSQPTNVVVQNVGSTEAPLGTYFPQYLEPGFIVSNGVVTTYNWIGFSSDNTYILDFFFLGAALYERDSDPALRDYRSVEFSLRSTSVPGPLPLLGVGAAFGFSRKLRKRINVCKQPVASAID